MFKVNNRNTRIRCEICSKLTIKTPERRSYIFVSGFEMFDERIIRKRKKHVYTVTNTPKTVQYTILTMLMINPYSWSL